MSGSWILSGILALPLVGALFILLLPGDGEATKRNARWIALFATAITFVLSLVAWGRFDPAQPGFQLIEERDWFSHVILYKLGVDGVSMPFVLLTTFLMPICIVASWAPIQTRVKEYMICFLALEALLLGVFAALDIVLFYVFFEGSLIPMFIIIGIWGHGNRVYAAFKFFLYTLTGSLLMLLAIMAMYWTAGTTDITVLLKTSFPLGMQKWLWLGFFRLVRGQDADVAGAYVAARRPCRGSDCRLGGAGRHSPEIGRLRLHPVFVANVSGTRRCISPRSFSPCR